MLRRIAFDTVPAVDIDRAIAFWTGPMGLTLASDVTMEEWNLRWVMLGIPGAETGIHLDQVASIPDRPMPVIPLICEDVPGFAAKLEAAGVEIVQPAGPAEWDAGITRATIKDSEGNRILLASG